MLEKGGSFKWRVAVEVYGGRDVTGVAHALRVARLYDVHEAELGVLSPDDHDLLIMVDVGVPRRVLAPGSAAACFHAGANGFVRVPFIGNDLLQCIASGKADVPFNHDSRCSWS